MLIAIVGMDDGVSRMFSNWGHYVVNLINSIKTANEVNIEPDLVVFTGGADVTPFLYNEQNTNSQNDIRRDLEEMIWYHKFKHCYKLGICRGGQFLNVMEGGRMYQHIEGHAIADRHDLRFDGNTYKVTSTHHQGMIRNPALVYGGVTEKSACGKQFQELIWYPKAICFQPHPEYEEDYEDFNTQGLLYAVIKEWFGKDIV